MYFTAKYEYGYIIPTSTLVDKLNFNFLKEILVS